MSAPDEKDRTWEWSSERYTKKQITLAKIEARLQDTPDNILYALERSEQTIHELRGSLDRYINLARAMEQEIVGLYYQIYPLTYAWSADPVGAMKQIRAEIESRKGSS